MALFRYLTKSRYLHGLQCPKWLWLEINKPRDFQPPEIDAATRFRFLMGNKITEYARHYFENGIFIREDHNHLSQAIQSTKMQVKNNAQILLEACAEYNRILCRPDIIKKTSTYDNLWDMYEVKMTSRFKEEHIPDIAIQKYCLEKAGFPVRKAFLMHIDNSYVRKGSINPQQLFFSENVTRETDNHIQNIEPMIYELVNILDTPDRPEIEPGAQCSSPRHCLFFDYCNEPWQKYSIHELPHGGKRIGKLEKMGIKLLKNIPADFSLTYRQQQLVRSNKSKKPVINKKNLKAHLDKLVYPLYYFDFETLNAAIPLFDNSRPYQFITFQFSLHIQKNKNGKCKHHEFLLKAKSDPREKLVKEMLKLMGKEGSIVSYSISFEKSRIMELAEFFPQYRNDLLALLPRFWDLIIPFKSGDYAHYDFHGSASLKNVLPALVPTLSYDKLAIKEGGIASLKYEQWVSGDMKPAEWEQTCKDLLEYCKLDTLSMVKILKVLRDTI